MAQRLTDLTVDDASLVDVGANPHALVVFFKSHDTGGQRHPIWKVNDLNRGGRSSGRVEEEQLEALAKARQASINKSADNGESITYAKAYDMVIRENPGLYEQYRRERY